MGIEDVIDKVKKKIFQCYGHMRRMGVRRWRKKIWEWKRTP